MAADRTRKLGLDRARVWCDHPGMVPTPPDAERLAKLSSRLFLIEVWVGLVALVLWKLTGWPTKTATLRTLWYFGFLGVAIIAIAAMFFRFSRKWRDGA
jgi:hypothetical protein